MDLQIDVYFVVESLCCVLLLYLSTRLVHQKHMMSCILVHTERPSAVRVPWTARSRLHFLNLRLSPHHFPLSNSSNLFNSSNQCSCSPLPQSSIDLFHPRPHMRILVAHCPSAQMYNLVGRSRNHMLMLLAENPPNFLSLTFRKRSPLLLAPPQTPWTRVHLKKYRKNQFPSLSKKSSQPCATMMDPTKTIPLIFKDTYT